MKSILIAVITSIMLHSIMLMYKPNPPQPNKKKQKIEKEAKISIKLKSKELKKTSSFLSIIQKTSKEKCKDFYLGIGVTIDFLSQIASVAKGGPADKIGLIVGDTILSNIDTPNLKEGQVIPVSVSRRGIINTYNMTIERICKE